MAQIGPTWVSTSWVSTGGWVSGSWGAGTPVPPTVTRVASTGVGPNRSLSSQFQRKRKDRTHERRSAIERPSESSPATTRPALPSAVLAAVFALFDDD